MNVHELLRDECIETRISVQDKTALLQRIAELASHCPSLASVSKETLFEALENREGLGSTGFGQGIAIPHCRLDAVTEFVVGLLTIPAGVDFDAIDDEPVKLVLFIVGPKTESSEHIRLLSTLSHLLRKAGVKDQIIDATTPLAAKEQLLTGTPSGTAQDPSSGHHLFQVLVQNEDKFLDILEVFAGIDGCSPPVILDGHRATEFLSRRPLFAEFWTDGVSVTPRLLVTLVDKRMSNEMIRQIEQRVGPLQEGKDLLVMVQNLFYYAGGLED